MRTSNESQQSQQNIKLTITAKKPQGKKLTKNSINISTTELKVIQKSIERREQLNARINAQLFVELFSKIHEGDMFSLDAWEPNRAKPGIAVNPKVGYDPKQRYFTFYATKYLRTGQPTRNYTHADSNRLGCAHMQQTFLDFYLTAWVVPEAIIFNSYELKQRTDLTAKYLKPFLLNTILNHHIEVDWLKSRELNPEDYLKLCLYVKERKNYHQNEHDSKRWKRYGIDGDPTAISHIIRWDR